MEKKSDESPAGSLDWFSSHADHSWLRLTPDHETAKYVPNRKSREVTAGHFVRLKPVPLQQPTQIAVSENMARELGLSMDATQTEQFTKFFSGDVDVLPAFNSWATPYALSIMGTEMYDNCPFGNGNGYGDGRAISIGEVLLDNGKRWEMQLKGAGPTPFCRGADGRAVLRSSVREFLVSEAMHDLGVPTTRALSLVVSGQDTVTRQWYSDEKPQPLTEADPRLAQYPAEMRTVIVQQINARALMGGESNVRLQEKCAITTRVSPSFLRVGHVELFGRRLAQAKSSNKGVAEARVELDKILDHLIEREYPQLKGKENRQEQLIQLCEEVAGRISSLTANWIRVGFVQGNFNSDNCLAGGRTMDYGPFGFVQRFSKVWNMWVGGGAHYGFLNQPLAGHRNFYSFANAVKNLLNDAGMEKINAIVQTYPEKAMNRVVDGWTAKMGLTETTEDSHQTAKGLLELLEDSEADYTMFWRELSKVPPVALETVIDHNHPLLRVVQVDDETLTRPFHNAFYKPLSDKHHKRLAVLMKKYVAILQHEQARTVDEIVKQMNSTNPKYIPREHLLVEAYSAADKGDYGPLKALHSVLSRPYEEQPDKADKYYQKAPAETYQGAGKGGQAHMT